MNPIAAALKSMPSTANTHEATFVNTLNVCEEEAEEGVSELRVVLHFVTSKRVKPLGAWALRSYGVANEDVTQAFARGFAGQCVCLLGP